MEEIQNTLKDNSMTFNKKMCHIEAILLAEESDLKVRIRSTITTTDKAHRNELEEIINNDDLSLNDKLSAIEACKRDMIASCDNVLQMLRKNGFHIEESNGAQGS